MAKKRVQRIYKFSYYYKSRPKDIYRDGDLVAGSLAEAIRFAPQVARNVSSSCLVVKGSVKATKHLF